MSQFADNTWFSTVECCNCGMLFAMTTELKNIRLEDHKLFYCPAGHAQHFADKTEAQKLREELEQKAKQLWQEKNRSALIERQRDQVSKTYHRMRERVKNGVCPCCNRTFQNLMNHIKTKHPDFGSHDTLRTIRNIYGMTQGVIAKEIGVSAEYVSQFERQKYVPKYAKQRIEAWLDLQDEKVKQ